MSKNKEFSSKHNLAVGRLLDMMLSSPEKELDSPVKRQMYWALSEPNSPCILTTSGSCIPLCVSGGISRQVCKWLTEKKKGNPKWRRKHLVNWKTFIVLQELAWLYLQKNFHTKNQELQQWKSTAMRYISLLLVLQHHTWMKELLKMSQ